jgi:hypothetical protein
MNRDSGSVQIHATHSSDRKPAWQAPPANWKARVIALYSLDPSHPPIALMICLLVLLLNVLQKIELIQIDQPCEIPLYYFWLRIDFCFFFVGGVLSLRRQYVMWIVHQRSLTEPDQNFALYKHLFAK